MTSCQAVNPPDGLRCQVCFDTFHNPVQLFACTHIFCQGCVLGANTCPFCRNVVEYVKPAPVSIIQASLSLPVMCGSCGWKGTRADSKSHRCGITETHTTYSQYPQLPDEELYRRAATKGSRDIFDGPAPVQESHVESYTLPPSYSASDSPVNGIVFGLDYLQPPHSGCGGNLLRFMFTATNTAPQYNVAPSSFVAPVVPDTSARRRVLYFVDESTTAIAYAEDHMMRPSRVRALHSLVKSLGLGEHMTVCQPRPATPEELQGFHRVAYIECLRSATFICGNPLDPLAMSYQKEFGVPVFSRGGDCPLFPEVWELVASQAGASIACGEALCRGEADIAINWAGGMHHGAAAHASGFCFVNDIVLCIQRLLRRFQRVLYVDLDVHHGDGVEAAFYGNTRVMTVSLHQFGNGFFPGTGGYGSAATAHSFAVNVPLPMHTGDAAYLLQFRTVLSAVVSCFDPEAVVLQCGADAIVGDLIGRLSISTSAHAMCVADVLRLRLPTVMLGGGGYHVFRTARCWAIHTATALGRQEVLPQYIPRSDPYYEEYRKECAPHRPKLHVAVDPHVDRILPPQCVWTDWRKLCESIATQMRYARHIRESFLRSVSDASRHQDMHRLEIKKEEDTEKEDIHMKALDYITRSHK